MMDELKNKVLYKIVLDTWNCKIFAIFLKFIAEINTHMPRNSSLLYTQFAMPNKFYTNAGVFVIFYVFSSAHILGST